MLVAVEVADLYLHEFGLGFEGERPVFVEVADPLEGLLEEEGAVGFGEEGVDVAGGGADAVVEVGDLAHDADAVGDAEQQLVVELLEAHEVGLEVVEVELLLREELPAGRTHLHLHPPRKRIEVLDCLGSLYLLEISEVLLEGVEAFAEQEIVDDFTADAFIHEQAIQEGLQEELLLFYYTGFGF